MSGTFSNLGIPRSAPAADEVSGDAATQQTIIVIDDSDAARGRIVAALKSHGVAAQVLSASSGAEGLSLMAAHPVDLVLCDIEMPGIDGFHFLRLKNSRAEFADIPVIFLTIREELKAKVLGLSQGAHDYLTKPFYDEELVARVHVHLRLKALQDELRRKNKRLEEMSRADALTGLSNRRHFRETLAAELARSKRFDLPLSLILLDVDHFKQINDRYGHQAGDEALLSVASVLQRMLRRCDHAARYGGEEFAMILPQTGLEGAQAVAERCRRAVGAAGINTPSGVVRLTVSLGIADYPHESADSVDELIRRADEALYRAKDAGRNRVCA